MGSERREYLRAQYQCKIRYRPHLELMGMMWYAGTMTDFSASGLRFVGSQPLEPDSRVELEIALPMQDEPYSFMGRVAWEQSQEEGSYEYGVEFVDVTPDQQVVVDELARFLLKGRAAR
jgi:c-di-GMP-binding flagellar brake protein YcgR